jgi:pyruvate carboxylase subunit B
MSKVHITDTVLRDGHQSLIATRMRTQDMLPACPKLDAIGFWSLEVWGGATFDTCIRYLKEDPWERLRKLRQALPNTRLQMLLRGQNLVGYRHYSDDVVRAFVRRTADLGMDVFRIFDALNDARNLRTAIEAVKAHGKHAQGTICYTTSPVHGIAQFIELAEDLAEMGCDSIVIKDMAGLLTPTATAELVKELRVAVSLPIHVHTHATTGLAEMALFKAVESGCRHIDTALGAFGNSTSHSATESMVAAFSDTPHDTGLDLKAIQEVSAYFGEVRKKYHQFEGEWHGVDTRVLVNQVPGGMISNLHSQLRQQGAIDKLNAVLGEIPKVRADLGFPPLVTPTSQIVGTQAVINVLTGERYKTITNEVKLYLQGRYGHTPGPVDPDLQRRAIGNEPVIDVRPADVLKPEMERLRKEIGELAQSEEDVLTFAMFPEIGRDYLSQRAAGTLVPEPLEPPQKTLGDAQAAPVEFNVTLHGETYHIKLTGTGHKHQRQRPFYMTVDGIPEEILVEPLQELPAGAHPPVHSSTGNGQTLGGRPRATKPGDVTTSMPGSIVEVMVTEGATVKAGEPVLVTEAMKMETEITAPIAGKVVAIYVAKGDMVTPDETLIEIA